MKKFTLATLLAATVTMIASVVSIASPLPPEKAGWEKVSDGNGIVTHRKEVPGSEIVSFRGETMIEAPIAKVANVLIDTPRKLEWVHKIVEAKNIREISDYERIEYNHTSSGFFVVRDRDFVFHAKAELDKANKMVTFRLKSVEDSLMPETDKVRGSLNESAYILTSMNGGKSTRVVVEINADPRGSVPKWLVNIFQKAWPRKTLEALTKQCSKADVVEHPGIKAYFNEQQPVATQASATPAAAAKAAN